MHTGKGQLMEVSLADGRSVLRISCPPNLIPAPGQYLLAGVDASADPLPVPLYHTDSSAESCLVLPLEPVMWMPGQSLHLRGPLGTGFSLPLSARRVALAAWDGSGLILRGLIRQALKQGAAVVVLSDAVINDELPSAVEVQPFSVLADVLSWADYVAFETTRTALDELRERFRGEKQGSAKLEAQVFVQIPKPCGGTAECGVCAVHLRSGWRLGCKDGPVFALRELL